MLPHVLGAVVEVGSARAVDARPLVIGGVRAGLIVVSPRGVVAPLRRLRRAAFVIAGEPVVRG